MAVPHEILSHPFRLTAGGNVATVPQVSDAGLAEQIALLVQTRRGERHLAPAFGVTDPAFSTLEPGEVLAGVALFGPPVGIRGVTITYPDAVTEEVRIAFT